MGKRARGSAGPEHMGKDVAAFCKEFEAYCRKRGIKIETACVQACNYGRLFERLQTRTGKIYADIHTLRTYMEANPVGKTGQRNAKAA